MPIQNNNKTFAAKSLDVPSHSSSTAGVGLQISQDFGRNDLEVPQSFTSHSEEIKELEQLLNEGQKVCLALYTDEYRSQMTIRDRDFLSQAINFFNRDHLVFPDGDITSQDAPRIVLKAQEYLVQLCRALETAIKIKEVREVEELEGFLEECQALCASLSGDKFLKLMSERGQIILRDAIRFFNRSHSVFPEQNITSAEGPTIAKLSRDHLIKITRSLEEVIEVKELEDNLKEGQNLCFQLYNPMFRNRLEREEMEILHQANDFFNRGHPSFPDKLTPKAVSEITFHCRSHITKLGQVLEDTLTKIKPESTYFLEDGSLYQAHPSLDPSGPGNSIMAFFSRLEGDTSPTVEQAVDIDSLKPSGPSL